MQQRIAHVTLVVDDYDRAIDFYTRVLDFDVLEDTRLSDTKRWVIVAPKGNTGCNLLLAKAVGDDQTSRIGNQTGGRVAFFLHTDDLRRDFQRLQEHNVRIVRGPVEESYGTVAVFSDLYGNLWDLIQPKP
ncbi:VOC family protein [Fibrisoma limi]|nr:VOC family protein [Fibrisoma limi]